MPKKILLSLSAMLLLVVSGCSSTPPVQRTERPAPPGWMMAPAPDLLTPLNGIISSSESESKLPESK